MIIPRNKSQPTEVAKPVQPAEPAMALNTAVEPDPVPETVIVNQAEDEVESDDDDL